MTTTCIRPLALGLLAVVLIAADPPAPAAYVAPPTAETWEQLKATHIDQLVEYVSAGGALKNLIR